MDPNEPRSKSPSLLDADSHGASPSSAPERILSGRDASTSPPSNTQQARRWLWPSALLLVGCAAVLLLVLSGAFDDPESTASSRMTTHVEDNAASSLNATASPDAQYGDGALNAAVILPESPESADAQAMAAPAPAATASKDSMALSDVFTPASERPHAPAARRVVKRAPSNDDSDVTLLTALIQHVEVGGTVVRRKLKKAHHVNKPAPVPETIEARMQTCPAANTEAGLRCRQKLCAGHAGEAAACPAASSDAG